jgi:hypothetical protein
LRKSLSFLIGKVAKYIGSLFKTIQSSTTLQTLLNNEIDKRSYQVIESQDKMTPKEYVQKISMLYTDWELVLQKHRELLVKNDGLDDMKTNDKSKDAKKQLELRANACQHGLLWAVYYFFTEFPKEFAEEACGQKKQPFMLDLLSIYVINLLNHIPQILCRHGPLVSKALIENLEREISALKLEDNNANSEYCQQELIQCLKSKILNGVSLPIEGNRSVEFQLYPKVKEALPKTFPSLFS